MTTDQILEELREYYNLLQDSDDALSEDAQHIIVLFDDLDNMIIAGHPLPKEWRNA